MSERAIRAAHESEPRTNPSLDRKGEGKQSADSADFAERTRRRYFGDSARPGVIRAARASKRWFVVQSGPPAHRGPQARRSQRVGWGSASGGLVLCGSSDKPPLPYCRGSDSVAARIAPSLAVGALIHEPLLTTHHSPLTVPQGPGASAPQTNSAPRGFAWRRSAAAPCL